MENQNTQTAKTMDVTLGISEERNEQLVNIVIKTIQDMDANGVEVNRSTVIQECEKTLPADMTRLETLYMGHMVQEKGGQFVNMKAMENMKNNPGSLAQMLINALGLSDDEDDDDSSEGEEKQPADPQLN
jgi:hypothetical protein